MRKNMKLSKNDEAVSPVIGVILMVAITVILAAVIATFVFEMGTPVKTPMVNMQIKRAQVTTDTINLTHSGGETVKLSDVKLIVYNSSSYKTTVNPLLEFGNVTALAPGNDLILQFSPTGGITSIYIDGRQISNLGTKTNATGTTTNYYFVANAGESVTVEFWYIPSGQRLGKIDGATIP